MSGSAAIDFDIVISGGGMVGGSLALALAGLPLRILVVEATPPAASGQPSYDDRATAVAESSRRILDALGVWRALAGGAAPIREIHVSERGAFGSVRLRAAEHGLPSFGQVVENRALGAAIWDRLESARSVSVCSPARVVALARQDELVQVGIEQAGGECLDLRTRLLVAADGARSPARQLAGIGHTMREYGQTALIANITPDRDHHGVAYERFTASGPLAVLPLAGGRVTAVWTLPPEQAAEFATRDDAAFLTGLQAAFGHRLGTLGKAGRRASYPLSLVQAEAWYAHRVVLVGNAAHGIHPVAGQGFNLGLRDAAALAELVAAGGDPGAAAMLEHYAQWREADRSRTIRDTDGLVQLFTSEFAPLRAGRRLGLLGLDLLPPARAALARRGMGLSGRLPRLALGQPLP